MVRSILFTLMLLTVATVGKAQWEERGPRDFTGEPWPASWITHPTAPATAPAVVNFRRTFDLPSLPDSLPVLISADNRYQLYVNGLFVGEGPSRGDLLHWRYERYDLKRYLKPGKNVVSAIVWNYGIEKAWFQHSYRLGFLFQPVEDAWSELMSGPDWKTFHNEAYSLITDSRERLGTYVVVGPQLRIDGNLLPAGWMGSGFDDNGWQSAKSIVKAAPAGVGTEFYWALVPRTIPQDLRGRVLSSHDYHVWQRSGATRNYRRIEFEDLVVPANSERTFLIDLQRLINFYPEFAVEGGEGSTVRLTYAESLFADDGTKGHRDSIQGKLMRGVYDEFIVPDEASSSRYYAFETLWFRTGRYLEISVSTREEPLTVAMLVPAVYAYPFRENGTFKDVANTYRTDEIWSVGWQTARMCAQETYVDCPYYEQLQYVGDTRIQALISLYVSGDDRLMRKAIETFGQSRLSIGLTQSRYPSNVPQVIPPYSLSWVDMVGDYWWHRPDTAFVRRQLPGIESVLEWYRDQIGANGLVTDPAYWNFVDWAPEWPWQPEKRIGGVPDLSGGSAILSLQYAVSLRTAARLFASYAQKETADRYAAQADRLVRAVREHCFDRHRNLFRDAADSEDYSQHVNILAILSGAASEEHTVAPKQLLSSILLDPDLIQVSEYYRFYLIQAMHAAGRADLYPEQLKVWREHLKRGFTTWPEKPGKTRSDCHAWSASPNYDLLATVAGIRPAEPGFAVVAIDPAPVPGWQYEATVPHPAGLIRVQCAWSGGRATYNVQLPNGVAGVFGDGQAIRANGQVQIFSR